MSSTMITNPAGNVGKGSGGRSAGVVSGAAQGAAAGAVVGGPIGAVVGGVIGGIAGAIGGNSSDASLHYANKAAAWGRLGKEREAAIVYRDYIRAFRAKRAMQMVGITSEDGGSRSSAPRGAVDSLGSQFAFGQAFFQGQIFIQNEYSKNIAKAKKHAANAERTFGQLGAVTSLATSFGSLASFGKASGGPVSQTPVGSNTYGGGDWSTFGSGAGSSTSALPTQSIGGSAWGNFYPVGG